MNNIDISVVVLTYYHEQYIARALDSILSQKTTYSYEIIVSDDCSGDNTVSILQSYREKYPDKIRLILNTENLGTCQSLYNALTACRGRYIDISAGDDRWPIEDKLQRQLDFLETHEDFFACCVLSEGFCSDNRSTGEIYPPDKTYWGKEYPLEVLISGKSFSDAGIVMHNVLNREKGRETFGMLPKLSKYIEDLPMDFMLYDFGKVYLTDYVGYAITQRQQSDTNQHNYNTLFRGYKQAIQHVELINNMDKYFQGRYDFTNWMVPRLADAIIAAVRMRKPSIIAQLPKIKFNYWPKALVLIFSKAVHKLTGR